MKKYIYLIVMLLLCVKALAQGHIPGTVLPAVPTTAPWNVYTAAPDQRQNAAVTNAQSLALVPTGTNGTDIFVTYNVNTTGYNFYLVYTTNGSVPTKTNGTVVNMSFAVFSASNRIWAGKIPQQPAGTIVNYVIYVNTTGGTLAAANNRVSSAVFGIESSWTEGNRYYTFIASGGVPGPSLWLKADAGTNTTINGNAVTTWNDQSGNLRNVSSSSPGSGVVNYNTASGNPEFNFNPSINFDNTNDALGTSTALFPPVGGPNATFFGVSNKDGAAFLQVNISGSGGSGALSYDWPQFDSNGIFARFDTFNGWSAGYSSTGTRVANGYINSGTGAGVGRGFSSNGAAFVVDGNWCYLGDLGFVIGSDQVTGDNATAVNNTSEVIAYQRQLSALEKRRIDSYLAIKYGVTLSQTTPQNYLSSAGSTIWDATTLPNPSYSNNIAGIARDDASGLNQYQSQSMAAGIQPVIALGDIFATNQANTNSFPADLSALVWGSNTGSTSFATPFAFGGNNSRMTRIWRVQETGTVGTVKVALRASDITVNATSPALVVSSDATFDGTDTRTVMTLETLGGVQYYTATVDFASGQFFTFAALVTAPGGVTANLGLWLKADTGTNTTTNGGTVTNWNDQSGNARNFTAAAGSVLYQTPAGNNRFNFNPSFSFVSGISALATTDTNYIFPTAGPSSATFFGVTDNDSFTLLKVNNNLETNAFAFYDYPDVRSTQVFARLNSGTHLNPTYTGVGTISRICNSYLNSGTSVGISFNGGVFNVANGAYSTYNGRMTIGSDQWAGGDNANVAVNGNISEDIAYTRRLTAVEEQRVNSYLAIKYGITLDQSAPQNYLNSSGSTVWNATTNTGYNNNIAGIARDDASALNQKQSASVNGGIQPVIGNGNVFDTNANNTNNFSADLSALVWGSDTGSTSFATSFAFGGLNYRMARIWKVQETGTVGNVKVALRASDLSGNVAPALVVSSDAVFDGTDARTAMTLETLGGVQYYTATVDFTTGQFFTFAALVTAPGGVSGASLWVKADAGVGNTTYFNVPSGNRTASSSFSGLGPANSTLSSGTSWSAATATTGDFLTLDLGSSQTVRGVVTKGRGDSFAQWVTSYTVGYSTDNVNYVSLGSFNGNVDQVTEVVNLFPSAVTARYIRFTVTGYSGFPSMRADVVSTLTNATADNTAINFWNDQSGNGRNFVNVTANPVLYQTTASNSSFNFNPSLNFGATTAALGSGSTLFPASPVSSATFFGVTNVGGFLFLGVNNNLETVNTAKYDYPLFGNGYVYARINSGAAVNPTVTPASGTSISTGYLSNGTSAGIASNGGNFSVLSGSYGTYTGAMSIGSNQWANGDNANPAVGNIPELIAFNQQLTAPQRLQVESYLATKYGITLNQTTAQNYLASDGSTITWNATANSSYKNNIAGIGRDDLTALYQKQSQSINSGSQVVMALGTVAASNQANANTIPVNNQFFTWGDDNGSLSTFVSTGNITYPSRFTRIWKTQNTGGFAQNMTVYYPVSAFGTSVASSVGILYGTTAASLSDGSASIILQSGTTTINGVSHYAFTVPAAQVANMQFFSFSGSIVCYKPAVTVGTTLDTKHGITALGRAGSGDPDNWPMVRKGAWTVLEAKTKGFVINRLTAAQIAAIPPANLVEGMMIYDTTNNCMKVYTSTDGGTTFNWQCISTQTCPD